MVQYLFSARTQYVGKIVKSDLARKRVYVNFGMFGTKWVPLEKCIVLN